jgi:hypothetical protein
MGAIAWNSVGVDRGHGPLLQRSAPWARLRGEPLIEYATMRPLF